ncbi:hypothetical protein [Massilia alkalitolerans]|uniref:hypothetical protein n=1 Tax=Massilia alkalitolerans TaxID=286638 RepID=UPI000404EDB5|nr:hypothetical protein [Massilia alkalitolerans]
MVELIIVKLPIGILGAVAAGRFFDRSGPFTYTCEARPDSGKGQSKRPLIYLRAPY